jgi:septum site-determining protein MinD
MSEIVAAHSFKGGIESSIIANAAACLAFKGKRVCIIDADIQSPGVHVFFGPEPENNYGIMPKLDNDLSTMG